VIAVVADDFTGAAELAAVGLRYGLSAEVQTVVDFDSKADLVAIDTDTRSRAPQEAAAEVKRVVKKLQKVPAEWIYKKVDSVLRGPVVAELEAVLTSLGRDRIMLVPANPFFGRKLYQGHYFINDKPLDETDFAGDPEYPAVSSDVLTMLGPTGSLPTCVLNIKQAIPSAGIVVGEASSETDLTTWARYCDDRTVPAGAAEFFAALLEVRGFRLSPPASRDVSVQSKTSLFVCASSSHYSHKAVEEARGRGIGVSEMPPELLQPADRTDELLQRWTDDTITAIERHAKVIVAIGQPIVPNPQLAQNLRLYTAALVENVLKQTTVDEVYIEGGATASAVVGRLGWTRLSPCCELAPGVVRMRVQQERHQYLTVKPGSYPSCDEVWPGPP
jgi:uncharacterized protein YgbK (DUF1537 family)